MDLDSFVKDHNVDYSNDRVNESFLSEIEKLLDVKIGEQLREYILNYGYLGYKHIELLGINNLQKMDSDMIQQTLFVHKHFSITEGLIVVEDRGDGDYYLVDGNDMVWRFIADSRTLSTLNIKLAEYILARFSEIQ